MQRKPDHGGGKPLPPALVGYTQVGLVHVAGLAFFVEVYRLTSTSLETLKARYGYDLVTGREGPRIRWRYAA